MPRSMTKLAAVLVAAAGLSFALADYTPSRDVHVKVDAGPANRVADALPIDAAGSTLFHAQERVHRTVSKTTGTSVDHHYIWIGVGHQSVPVDPFDFNR